MITLSPLAERRKRWAMELGDEFAYKLRHPESKYLNLPFSTDPSDSVGISWLWGFTPESLFGAAFFYVARWHDARQKYFDMPIREADALALKWARFTAQSWPDEGERRTLIRVVRYLGWVIPVYGTVRWKWIAGKS